MDIANISRQSFAASGVNSLPILTLTFMVSRVIYWLLGVRFLFEPDRFWQFVNSDILRSHFGESLWYLHTQPPLLNFLLGVAYQLFDEYAGTALNILFIGLGLLLTISIYQLLMSLQVPQKLALIASVLYTISPVTVLYENYFMSTYPIAALMPFSFWFFARFVKSASYRDGLLFAFSIIAMAYIRSSVHLIWVIFVVGLALRYAPARRSKYIALIAVVFVALLYIKNFYLFGNWSTSTWFPMSWYNVVSQHFPRQDYERMLASGELLMPAGRLPFQVPIQELGNYTPRPEFDHVALFASETIDGQINRHHYAFIEFSSKFLHDDLVMIRYCPACYLRSLVESSRVYLISASEHGLLGNNNLDAAGPLRWLLNNVIYGRLITRLLFGFNDAGNTYPLILLGVPTVLVAGYIYSTRALLKKDALAPALFAMSSTCIFFAATYILFEVGENQRFRFETDVLIFVLACFLLWRFASSFRARIARETHH